MGHKRAKPSPVDDDDDEDGEIDEEESEEDEEEGHPDEHPADDPGHDNDYEEQYVRTVQNTTHDAKANGYSVEFNFQQDQGIRMMCFHRTVVSCMDHFAWMFSEHVKQQAAGNRLQTEIKSDLQAIGSDVDILIREFPERKQQRPLRRV